MTKEAELYACPCCGYKTLEERGIFEVCTVCHWEDDGTDTAVFEGQMPFLNPFIHDPEGLEDHLNLQEKVSVMGVMCNGVNLLKARINFLENGIYDPEPDGFEYTTDLIENFERGRVFEWNIETQILSEPSVGWKFRYDI